MLNTSHVIIDPHIQVGDIRICSINDFDLHAGDVVEIVGEHPDVRGHWYLKFHETGEMWVYANEPRESALNYSHLQELVLPEYEICD